MLCALWLLHMCAGPVPPIDVSVEVRSGSKNVTRVRACENFALNLDVLAKLCSKVFACSTSVQPIITKVCMHASVQTCV